jgi:hypothetical protein
LVEKTHRFGISFHCADHMLSESAATAGVVAKRSATDRDDANRTAAESDQADGEATDGQGTHGKATDAHEYPERTATKREQTQGHTAESTNPTGHAPYRNDARSRVTRGEDSSSMSAELARIGVRAEGNVV